MTLKAAQQAIVDAAMRIYMTYHDSNPVVYNTASRSLYILWDRGEVRFARDYLSCFTDSMSIDCLSVEELVWASSALVDIEKGVSERYVTASHDRMLAKAAAVAHGVCPWPICVK